jgi:hypothetical protein
MLSATPNAPGGNVGNGNAIVTAPSVSRKNLTPLPTQLFVVGNGNITPAERGNTSGKTKIPVQTGIVQQ